MLIANDLSGCIKPLGPCAFRIRLDILAQSVVKLAREGQNEPKPRGSGAASLSFAACRESGDLIAMLPTPTQIFAKYKNDEIGFAEVNEMTAPHDQGLIEERGEDYRNSAVALLPTEAVDLSLTLPVISTRLTPSFAAGTAWRISADTMRTPDDPPENWLSGSLRYLGYFHFGALGGLLPAAFLVAVTSVRDILPLWFAIPH